MTRMAITVEVTDNKGQPVTGIEALQITYPVADVSELGSPETIGNLEAETVAIGFDLLRRLFGWRVESWDAHVAAHRRHQHQACQVSFDGKKELTIASLVGRVKIRRQVCECHSCDYEFIPLNQFLPDHDRGILITWGLEELASLLAIHMPYEPAQEVVGRATHDPKALSACQVEEIILAHGQAIRRAESLQAQTLLATEGPPTGKPALVPTTPPRRETAWAEEVIESVQAALEAEAWDEPPEGVSAADWERLAHQVHSRQAAIGEMERLARLGPRLRPHEVLVALDGILVSGRQAGSRIELRVARLATIEGHRYITGVGEAFLTRVVAGIRALAGKERFLVVVADGARWIRDFFTNHLAAFPNKELVLDWYHLTKKCKELLSMITRGRAHRREVLRQLMPLLWEGQVEQALAVLEALRNQARNLTKLDELIAYLDKHQTEIPNYRQRRANCQYNGSTSAEKACDLLVARRQKRKAMHWVEKGADALCALQTLWYNRAWDLYWKPQQVLPLTFATQPATYAC